MKDCRPGGMGPEAMDSKNWSPFKKIEAVRRLPSRGRSLRRDKLSGNDGLLRTHQN
jgi:hypothetical protein